MFILLGDKVDPFIGVRAVFILLGDKVDPLIGGKYVFFCQGIRWICLLEARLYFYF